MYRVCPLDGMDYDQGIGRALDERIIGQIISLTVLSINIDGK